MKKNIYIKIKNIVCFITQNLFSQYFYYTLESKHTNKIMNNIKL